MGIYLDAMEKLQSSTGVDVTPFEDWVVVILAEEGGSYDWHDFKGFYDPTTDAFYWASGAGCSCDEWGSYLYSPADFESSKSKDDMQRAYDRYRQDCRGYMPPSTDIRDFKKPRNSSQAKA